MLITEITNHWVIHSKVLLLFHQLRPIALTHEPMSIVTHNVQGVNAKARNSYNIRNASSLIRGVIQYQARKYQHSHCSRLDLRIIYETTVRS
jgi:hypothetical protein